MYFECKSHLLKATRANVDSSHVDSSFVIFTDLQAKKNWNEIFSVSQFLVWRKLFKNTTRLYSYVPLGTFSVCIWLKSLCQSKKLISF